MISKKSGWLWIAVLLLGAHLVVSAAVIRYAVNVEGTSGADVIRPDEEDVTDETITIRGDGNGIFEDGEDACSKSCESDKITGSPGSDIIFGDDGLGGVADTGHDWIAGGEGNDSIDGENGNDKLYGQEGDDQLSCSEGNDRLEGGNGDDMIDGGLGNDIIEGGPGTDTLSGGGGNDIFVLRPGDAGYGVETIFCTENAEEIGKILLRGSKLKGPFGCYRNTTNSFQILSLMRCSK